MQVEAPAREGEEIRRRILLHRRPGKVHALRQGQRRVPHQHGEDRGLAESRRAGKERQPLWNGMSTVHR